MTTNNEKNNTEKLKNFKKVYCDTLKKDEFGKNVMEIRIEDYYELIYTKHYLLRAIEELGYAHDDSRKIDDFGYIIKHLSALANKFDLASEIEGIEKLLED